MEEKSCLIGIKKKGMNALIVEDHDISSLGLQMIIEEIFENPKIEIARNGKEALACAKNESYSLILLDIGLPNTDTQALIENLKRISGETEILICSNNDPKIYAMQYLSMGASGYVQKSSSRQQIVAAIKMVLDGQVYVSKEVLQNNLGRDGEVMDQKRNFTKKLSRKELEVFSHLISGKRIKEISKIMNMHQSTASTLKKRVLIKADVDNIIDLKKKADENGFN